MKPRMRWTIAGAAAAVLLAVGLLLPVVQQTSNCGGNSAALAACNGYLVVIDLWAIRHEGRSFHFGQADPETRRELGNLPGESWLHSARLLARVEDVRLDPAAEKRILMVCDRPYDNVPRQLFGRAPMAHAVAYSTGETGLIAPEEFARLDLSGFVDLRTLRQETP
jgi:hypothetical protein